MKGIRLLLCAYGPAGERALRTLAGKGSALLCMTYDYPENQTLLKLSNRLGVKVATDDIGSTTAFERVHRFAPDLIVSIHYRDLVPQRILNEASLGGINLHPSLLPAYRGCFSSAWAIIRDEPFTGITYHSMTPVFDAGPIVLQRRVPIRQRETAGSLFRRLIRLGIENLEPALDLYINDPAAVVDQMGQSSYYPRKLPYDGCIDPSWSPRQVDCFIRAMTFPSKPPAFVMVGGKPISVSTHREYIRVMRDVS